ncbi:flagellar hook-length control protein FliK [Parasedimentitalea psychrophila]|uniref:Flagellar hook-length control protein FliK n=1 Tax=Parasedimentitalea psychrophila TaxID=2997337 RepID=A0A9Y2L2B6_9RHOB|nr:flagellar hook-length control protein FliK [Parasedimentitalea psychrophila]WIY26739.1 flagellar hook-length control protein FliK [Parasedimentitalea psychrophila]
MPKPVSTDSGSKGATFQSYYSASDAHQGAVRDPVQPDKSEATEDTQAPVSTDVADPSGPEMDQERAASGHEDVVVLEAAGAEILARQQTRSGAVTFSQGGAANGDVANDSATNVTANVVASQPEPGFTEAQSGQPVLNKGAEQPTHRSIAELRMIAAQPGAGADRQAMQIPGQIPDSMPPEDPLIATERADAGQKRAALGTAAGAGQSAPELQATQQVIRTADPRRAQVSPTGIRSNPQGIVTMAADQGKVAGLADGVQPLVTSSQEEQATPGAAAASDEVQTRTNRQPNHQVAAATPQPSVQVNPASQTAAAGQIAVTGAEPLADTLGASLILDPMGSEPAGLAQLLTEAVMSPGTTYRPETPRLVAAQLAEALATKGERNIDIALSPEELGRVKMRVSTTETSVVVMITTERPETGDLMRRHINELSEEFRRMGFEDISFEFSGEGLSGDESEQGDSLENGSSGSSDGGPSAENMQQPEKQNLRLGESGLDMRI